MWQFIFFLFSPLQPKEFVPLVQFQSQSSRKDTLRLQEMFLLRTLLCTRIQEQLELTQGDVIINIKCHVGKQKAPSHEQLQQSTRIPAQHYSKHHGLLFSTIATIMDSTAQHYGNQHGFHCLALWQSSWIPLLSTMASIMDSSAQHYSKHHGFHCLALQQASQIPAQHYSNHGFHCVALQQSSWIPLLSTIAVIMDSTALHYSNHHGFQCLGLQQSSRIPLFSTIAIIMDSCLVLQQSSWISLLRITSIIADSTAQHYSNHHGFLLSITATIMDSCLSQLQSSWIPLLSTIAIIMDSCSALITDSTAQHYTQQSSQIPLLSTIYSNHHRFHCLSVTTIRRLLPDSRFSVARGQKLVTEKKPFKSVKSHYPAIVLANKQFSLTEIYGTMNSLIYDPAARTKKPSFHQQRECCRTRRNFVLGVP